MDEFSRRGKYKRKENENRLSPEMIRKLRMRLNVSQEEFGLLVGVTACTVYWWECGKFKPSDINRELIIDLRKLGRREVKKVLRERSNSS